jgi:probable HAF family extracellular repeat protein
MAPVFTTLDDPLAVHGTHVYGINNNGQIVGDYVDASGHLHGFLFDAGSGTYTTIDDLSTPFGSSTTNFTDTSLQAINDAGVIAGYLLARGTGSESGFTYSGGTFMGGGGAQSVDGINNLNHFAGWYTDIFTSGHPSRGLLATGGPNSTLNNGGEIALNVPSSGVQQVQQTKAHGINNLDQIVGDWIGVDANVFGITSHGFFYNNGTYPIFDAPGAVNGTFAEGINDANLIVGYYVDGNTITHGYTFNQPTGQFTTLDFPGATQTFLTGINDAGQIVGYDNDASGQTHGFLYAEQQPPSNNDEWLLSNGHWVASINPGSHPGNAALAATGDFNHDGVSDVLWFNSNGDLDEWLIGANGKWAGSVDLGVHPAGGWQLVGTGDFNGDGTSDVLFYNSGNGQTDIWQLSNGHWAASLSPGTHPLGYQLAGIGDTNHDGTSDIIWFNPASGDVDEWKILNGKWAGSTDIGQHPGAGWQIGAVGDFNNDGTSDVFWFNPGNGQTDIWLLQNGKWSASVSPGSHPLGYTVVGAGDVNHDGTSDIVWYNPATGDVDEWLLANGKWAGSVALSHPGTGWLPALGDFNKDGTADVFWHNPLL